MIPMHMAWLQRLRVYPWRRRLHLLRWLACSLPILPGADAFALTLTLVLSEPGGIHLEAAQALRQELEQQGEGWRFRQQNLAERRPAEQEDLVVALGVRAYAALLSETSDTPLLALLVPRPSYERSLAERAQANGPRAVSALFLDQPTARQLRIVQHALPRVRRLGVLAGPEGADWLGHLTDAARAAGLELHARMISSPSDLFHALDALSDQTEALLLLPDAMVVNRASLRNLLLQTYHKRLPVLGYSAALTDAGAILGLYATPTQLGREAAQMIHAAARGGELRLPAARHPDAFSLRINRSVARSLGLTLSTEAELSLRIR